MENKHFQPNKKIEENDRAQAERKRKLKQLALGATAFGAVVGTTAFAEYDRDKNVSTYSYKLGEVYDDKGEEVLDAETISLEDAVKMTEEAKGAIVKNDTQVEKKENKEILTVNSFLKFKELKPELPFYYKQINPEDDFQNLQLPGQITRHGISGKEGKLILALRFKPLVNTVIERYENFPEELKDVVLSQIIEESTGMLYLPNSLGDGGFGVIHMQGQTAHEYGLKTFGNCDAMVCDGKDDRSCTESDGKKKNHAQGVKWIINSGKYSRAEMAEKDERLNPILNIDAAARMLLSYYYAPPIPGLSRAESAIRRYSGKYNYKAYKKDIEANTKMINSKEEYKKAEEFFNSKNSAFTINGKKGDLKGYLEANYRHLENFGLEEYSKLPKVKYKKKA